MLKTSKTLTLFALVVLLSGCGKFGFVSRLVMEGKISEAKFLTLDAGKSVGYGLCSPFTVSAWARSGVAGASLVPVQFNLGGLRSGDLVFSDAACKKEVKADQLSLPAVAVSVTYYLKTASVGTLALVATPSVERFSAVRQSVPVAVVLASMSFNTGSSISLPAGYCSSPIGINLKDGAGAPFSASNQTVQIAGGDGIVFSDSACTNPIPAATLKVSGSSVNFYFRKNSAVGGAIALVLKDPANEAVGQASLSVSFSSVPHRIEIVGGPTNLVLGVCNAVGYQIRLLDVDGNLASPTNGSSLTVQIGSSGGGLVNYRAACSAVSPILTNLVFSAGENSKIVYADARSAGSLTLRAWINNSNIAEAYRGPITVDRLPVSLQVVAVTPTVLAGSVASFTVTLLDGLGNPMVASNNIVVNLSEGTVGSGTFNSSTIAVLSGYSSAGFTYTPGSDAPTFTQTVNASATAFGRSISGSDNLSVNARVPVAIQISGGPSGSIDLGVCAPTPFSITLLAADGNPVAPRAGAASVSVALGFATGTGSYMDVCGGTAVSTLVFNPAVSTLSVNFIPTFDSSVTLRATSTGLTAGTKTVTINPAVPVAVVLGGPSAVTAGVPAGPYTVTVKDAINRNIAAAAGGVSAPISLAASTRSSFCTAAKCPSTASSLTVVIPQGSAVSSGFYLLSDSDSTQNPVAGGMSASPTNGLRASTLPLSITRTSLALDPNFGSSGQTSAPVSGFEGGEIRASLYSSGKLISAGFQTQAGSKRMAMARFTTDRGTAQGLLDSSFSGNGTMVLSVGDESWASALVAQGSGYLVAGVTRTGGSSGDYDIFLQRVRNDGSPDNTFRYSAGAPEPFVLAGNQYVTALVVGTDNTIYVIGYTDAASPSPSNPSDLIIAAFNADGTPISGGVDTYDFGGNQEIASTALVQSSGGVDRILIGGSIGMGTAADALFTRVMGLRGSTSMNFLSADPNFGNAGMVRYDLGGFGDSIRAMVMQPSNRLVAVGSRGKSSGSSVSMIGLQFNGNKDSGFGSNGIANYDISGATNSSANDVALDGRTGAIYLAGSADSTLLLARYNQDGTSDGMPSTARVSGTSPVGYALALAQDAKPVVAGVNGGQFNVWGALR
jgi:uncharacterized delta-60 repeat protein